MLSVDDETLELKKEMLKNWGSDVPVLELLVCSFYVVQWHFCDWFRGLELESPNYGREPASGSPGRYRSVQ